MGVQWVGGGRRKRRRRRRRGGEDDSFDRLIDNRGIERERRRRAEFTLGAVVTLGHKHLGLRRCVNVYVCVYIFVCMFATKNRAIFEL